MLTEPALPDPAPSPCPLRPQLARLKATANVKGQQGSILLEAPQLLDSSACGALVDLETPLKMKNDGSKKPGKGKLKLRAKGVSGTKPRTDKDSALLICLPREAACRATTTTSITSTTVPTTTTTILRPGFCGDGTQDAVEE